MAYRRRKLYNWMPPSGWILAIDPTPRLKNKSISKIHPFEMASKLALLYFWYKIFERSSKFILRRLWYHFSHFAPWTLQSQPSPSNQHTAIKPTLADLKPQNIYCLDVQKGRDEVICILAQSLAVLLYFDICHVSNDRNDCCYVYVDLVSNQH